MQGVQKSITFIVYLAHERQPNHTYLNLHNMDRIPAAFDLFWSITS